MEKKKVLIVPDISGWIVEDMAVNIMEALKDEFDFTLQVAELEEGKPRFTWEQDLDKFDLIFLMLPSYVPARLPVDINKVVTTFHGGPASEGQADHLQRAHRASRFGSSPASAAHVQLQVLLQGWSVAPCEAWPPAILRADMWAGTFRNTHTCPCEYAASARRA